MGWAFARACDGVLKIDRVQDGGRRGAGDLDPEAVKRGKNGARNGGDGQEPDHDLRPKTDGADAYALFVLDVP
jgi:hypothetical protein